MTRPDSTSSPYPLVSVIIPALNEQDYISQCIATLLDSSFPQDKLEIFVIDGGSSDNTVDVVKQICSNHHQVRFYHNPNRIVSEAMNIGAENAKGEILVRIDAHALYHSDYLKNSVETLIETDASGVGGVIESKGKSLVGDAIAFTVSHSIGTGGASWRSGTTAGWVESIWCGCYWKDEFLAVGGFNKDWVVNQDAEFNSRLSGKFRGLYFNPKIKATYFVRNRFRELASQYYRYGWWRAKTFLKFPKSLRLRQIIPVMFFVIFLIGLLTLLKTPIYFTGLMLVYLIALFISFLPLKKFDTSVLLAPIAALIIHTSWGAGFLIHILTFPLYSLRSSFSPGK